MISDKSNNTSVLGLILGFTIVFILMVTLDWLGLSHMRSTQERLQRIVNVYNVKLDLTSHLRRDARERSLNLHRMILLDDPFERDKEWMLFNKHGASFALDRQRLIDLGLDEQEKQIIAAQSALTTETVAAQNRAAELAIEEQHDTAYQHLMEVALPLQERVFAELDKLYTHQEEASKQAASEATETYEEARYLTILLSALALITGIIVATVVIRRSAQSEATLFREKERAQVTLHSIADGVITTDARGRVGYLNTMAENLTGWSSQEAQGHALLRVFNIHTEGSQEVMADPVRPVLQDRQIALSNSDIKLATKDGGEHAIEYTASPILDHDGSLFGAVLVFRDVTKMRLLSHQLTYQATHDALTGLINRREFENRLNQALSNARSENLQHALCYLDLDQFKIINDTCGHLAGDELLKQLTKKLRSIVRDGDVLARLGGDEFGVLLESCPTHKAVEIADKIRDFIHKERFVWDGKTFEVGVSIGLIPIEACSGTLYDVLSLADAACYVAKDSGRNRIHVYSPDDEIISQRSGEMNWVHRINQALEENRFLLYAQEIRPLRNAPAGACSHYEILLRMLDEEQQAVMPMAFIPAAERYNLMPAIDRWVIGNTCRLIREFPRSRELQTMFTINLSGQSLCDESFFDFLVEHLKCNAIPADRVCFEITETAAIANLSNAIKLITTIKQLGYHFALDDFGSGLSSFSYLKTLPVDYLKIDGSFIREIKSDSMDRLLVESMHQVAEVLGMHSIAEFVEDEETVALLEEIGVHYAQGYGIARPQPLIDVLHTTTQALAG